MLCIAAKRFASVALTGLVLGACQQNTRPTVSLDEAKQVTARFEGSSFEMPPRTIDDLKPLLDIKTESWQTCTSDLIPLQELREIFLTTSSNSSSDLHPEWATTQRFHNMAHTEYMNGYIDRSIALVEMSEGTYPDSWTSADSILANLRAKYHAVGGGLEATQDALDAGGFTETAYHDAVRRHAQAAVANALNQGDRPLMAQTCPSMLQRKRQRSTRSGAGVQGRRVF